MANVITEIEQVTPAWLTQLLREKGYLSEETVTKISEIQRSQTNASQVYHLLVQYSHPAAQAPARLFLKIPNPELAWADKEVVFYNTIVPAMVSNHPGRRWPFLHCYEAVYSPETGRAYLLLEELSETHLTQVELIPPSPKHRRQVIEAYALFHAYWWEHPRLGQDIGQRLDEAAIVEFLSSAQKKMAHFVDFAGQHLTEAQHTILERVATAWPVRRRERIVQGKGLTLVHRDPHPRNFLYPRDPETGEVKLIDWQSWRIDTGTDDLAYLMACHWAVDQNGDLELTLLKHYHEQLVALEVKNYEWEACWYDYRASIIRCLFFLMVAWSPVQWAGGSWWNRISRGLAAFKRWNCSELLRD